MFLLLGRAHTLIPGLCFEGLFRGHKEAYLAEIVQEVSTTTLVFLRRKPFLQGCEFVWAEALLSRKWNVLSVSA